MLSVYFTLRYFVNGEDCGTAAVNVPAGVRVVVDLAGQTNQVHLWFQAIYRSYRYSVKRKARVAVLNAP